MMKISWVDHVTNEEVARRAGTERKIMKTIRKRQLEFLGHVTRKEGLEELMLTGCVNGKRSRGRQRLTYLQSLSNWTTEQVDERVKPEVPRLKILRTAKDRVLWKSMVTNAWKSMFLENMARRERERERGNGRDITAICLTLK